MKHLSNESGTITKYDTALMIFLAVLVLSFAAVIKYRDKTHKEMVSQRVERMNAHIKYLHDEEGYSWRAARIIGATEAGFVPMDEEYLSLKED